MLAGLETFFPSTSPKSLQNSSSLERFRRQMMGAQVFLAIFHCTMISRWPKERSRTGATVGALSRRHLKQFARIRIPLMAVATPGYSESIHGCTCDSGQGFHPRHSKGSMLPDFLRCEFEGFGAGALPLGFWLLEPRCLSKHLVSQAH
jgi:hypothetical protein